MDVEVGMITYTTPWAHLPQLKVPQLHRVTYGYSSTPQARHEWSLKDHNIRAWCDEHCYAPYYMHPGYTNEKFVQFEDSQDAMLFALRWA